jgi:Ca2+-binding RTX toxin-like protein
LPTPSDQRSRPAFAATSPAGPGWGGGNADNSYDHRGAGADLIVGGFGRDTITGGGGSYTIYAGHGDDLITGGAGQDIIYGGPGHDTIDGGTGADTIVGGNGPDVITGGAGADLIVGGNGKDTITAGTGSDTIYAGHGDDLIIGGAGQDVTHGGHHDTVVGFSFAHGDTIQFSGETPATIDQVVATSHVQGSNTTITLHDGSTMTLVGITHLDSSFFH